MNKNIYRKIISPSFIFKKIMEHGLNSPKAGADMLERDTREFRAKIMSFIEGSLRKRGINDTLYAFYDLEVSPETYDIVKFLVLAENERIVKKCLKLHIIFVPSNEKDGFQKEYYHYFESSQKQWRLRNLLIPCCWLIPSCRNITVCNSRDEGLNILKSSAIHKFPSNYSVSIPVNRTSHNLINNVFDKKGKIPSICATGQAIEYVNIWKSIHAKNKKLITITLRESTNSPDRNSNVKAWGDFAKQIDKSKYFPVIIRDFEKAFAPIPTELEGIYLFNEAIWNIEIRAAIYELAYINFVIGNGPCLLCTSNKKTKYILLKMITNTALSTTEKSLLNEGMPYGSQFKYASSFQKIVWEDDTLDVINREFMDMSLKIQNHHE